eukprot:6197744-Pleurochrysis_carterae.AAC.3
MSEAEQAAAERVRTGGCTQHNVRNISLAAILAAGAAHLKAQLADSLADFVAYERMRQHRHQRVNPRQLQGAASGGRLREGQGATRVRAVARQEPRRCAYHPPRARRRRTTKS